ncbi:MAG: PspC domain-containing protein [Bacteroidetes bacterium]|nr:PspC domain-containing protein [Bacteroidota bacterium]
MNKIIQINLAGQAVSIDEKAYQSLSTYLQTLENHFSNTQDGAEILADIEARIAELFFGKIKKGNAFINETDVYEAIALMGTPEDMGIEDDPSESSTKRSAHKSTDKKLYRDTDDRVLGGVCSGLAAYFNFDTSIMRIIAVLLILFTGVPLIAYFVLWAILPEATTPEDRSRMFGGNTTVNDIVNNVRKEATDVANSVKSEATQIAERLKKKTKHLRTEEKT